MSSTPSRADQHTGNTETKTTRDASVLIGKEPRLDSLLGRSLSTHVWDDAKRVSERAPGRLEGEGETNHGFLVDAVGLAVL
jgi:hypothetical protein